MHDPISHAQLLVNRRHFFGKSASGIGIAALSSMLGESFGESRIVAPAPKAKRMIYLFQSGAPSPQDLFDYKPKLQEHHGKELGDFVDLNQRKTGMTAGQKSFPIAGTKYQFQKHGRSGIEISELLPHISGIADEICLIRSMYTEAINHDPAITFFQTGSQIPGRPSMGSWLSYGLGSVNKNLPDFVSMVSRGTGRPNCQPLYDRLWGSGFLPTKHAGVKFMSVGDPVLYLSNPAGFSAAARRKMLDDLAALNEKKLAEFADPEIETRIQQYELAYRMQLEVPEVMNIDKEPESIREMYGLHNSLTGSFGRQCLLARRLVEQGVRFIQIFAGGWDSHDYLERGHSSRIAAVDQAWAALIKDLKRRGMLEDTLVVWTGEFGRTPDNNMRGGVYSIGRGHNADAMSIVMAGGGVKKGAVVGATDDIGATAVDTVHPIRDFHVTLLHLLGLDDQKLTYFHGGRYKQLSQFGGTVISELLG